MRRFTLALILSAAFAAGCARLTPAEHALLSAAEASAATLASRPLPFCSDAEGIRALAAEQERSLGSLRQSLTERSWVRALLAGLAGNPEPAPAPGGAAETP